ncbi:MAG: tetratricopeptide repeat protein [Polyangiaceae bacterium]|nr:tetratricopeptide repeat protein [Polyangiaceae bacterium]
MTKSVAGVGAARDVVSFEPDFIAPWEADAELSASATSTKVKLSAGARRERGTSRVLFLAANALPARRIALDEEYRAITRRLRAAPARGSFEVISDWAVQFDDLQRCLLEHAPDVVHLAGHGTAGAELLLHGELGAVAPLPADALVSLFRTLRGNVSLVVLNACFSEEQAAAVRDSVGLAVGMSAAVDDKAAIAFSGAFYEALAYGRSVAEAFALGATAIRALGLRQAHVPRLFARDDVDPRGVFFAPPCRLRGEAAAKARALAAYALRRHRFVVAAAAGAGLATLGAGVLSHRWAFSRPAAPVIAADLPDVLASCERLRERQRVAVAAGPAERDEAGSLGYGAERAAVFYNLAEQSRVEGNHELADKLYACVLDVRRTMLGAQHPDVASTLRGRAKNYEKVGDFKRALPLLNEALAIVERAHGTEHPALLDLLNEMSEVHREVGEIARAHALSQRAYRIARNNPGVGSMSVAHALEALAEVYNKDGDRRTADGLLEQARELRDAAPRDVAEAPTETAPAPLSFTEPPRARPAAAAAAPTPRVSIGSSRAVGGKTYGFSLDDSPVAKKKAEDECAAKTKEGARRERCVRQAMAASVGDGIRFEKTRGGKWAWVAFGTTRDGKRVVYNRVVFSEIGNSHQYKLVIKPESDTGQKPIAQLPREMVIETPDESTIVLVDPTRGDLVFKAK